MSKFKKYFFLITFILLCISFNYIGNSLSKSFELPIRIDSLGTILSTFALGRVGGSVIAVGSNIIYNFAEPSYILCSVTSVCVAVMVGYLAKKKYLENLYGIFTASFITTIIATGVQVPINLILFDGYTSNKWGDGIIAFLLKQKVPKLFCYIIGEFYIDFIDNLFALLMLFTLVRAVRFFRNKFSFPKEIFPFALFVIIINSFALIDAKADTMNRYENFRNYMQITYNEEKELPGGTANDMVKNSDGSLLIGTYSGIYRYSGNDFKSMPEYRSISNVNKFLMDSEGKLLIGTNDNGLFVCIDNKIIADLTEDNGLPSNSIRSIEEVSRNRYYLGTSSHLAYVGLNGGLSIIKTFPEISFVISMASDTDGNLAVVTNAGELYIIKDAQIISRIIPDSSDSFHCCEFDINGDLYLGTYENKIVKYTLKDDILQKKKTISTNELVEIEDISFSEMGQMIVCAYNGVGYMGSNGKIMTINTDNFSSYISTSLIDYQGNLWFLSSRQGLLKLCKTPYIDVYNRMGLENKIVNAITMWQGNLYFATDNGIDIISKDYKKVINTDLTKMLEGTRVLSFLVDKNNNLLLSTTGKGVLKVDTHGKIKRYDTKMGANDNRARSAIELRDGSIAIAGDYGISFIKDDKVIGIINKHNELDNSKILCLYEMSDRTLLAGTDGSGIVAIKDGIITRILRRADGLSSDIIRRIVKDPKGEGVFIVTSNDLCFMDNNYNIKILNSFPYFDNYDLIIGLDGDIFVTGSDGIYVVNRDKLLENDEINYIKLDKKNGLNIKLTNNSRNYVDDKNNLYLAGHKRVTMINLKNYNIRYRSYRMNMDSIVVDDTIYPIKPGERIEIPRDAKSVVLKPEIVNYSVSNPRVKIYLEGFDTLPKIMYASDLKEVSYTNLDFGDYSFNISILDEKGEVIAKNEYFFTKQREFYDTETFNIYMYVVFILLIIYITWVISRGLLQKTISIQKREIELANGKLRMTEAAVLTIAKMVDAKDENTSQHSYRVAQYSLLIADKLGLNSADKEELRRAAMLHDIGKIRISDSILKKPSRLTDEEADIMRNHVVSGAEILRDFNFSDYIIDGARYHHERYDGSGYVEGLKGEDIPLFARIIGIADAFDAMTANRVYRKRLSFDVVLSEIKKGRGTQFDPQMADIMLELIEERLIDEKEIYEKSDFDNEQNEEGVVV